MNRNKANYLIPNDTEIVNVIVCLEHNNKKYKIIRKQEYCYKGNNIAISNTKFEIQVVDNNSISRYDSSLCVIERQFKKRLQKPSTVQKDSSQIVSNELPTGPEDIHIRFVQLHKESKMFYLLEKKKKEIYEL